MDVDGRMRARACSERVLAVSAWNGFVMQDSPTIHIEPARLPTQNSAVRPISRASRRGRVVSCGGCRARALARSPHEVARAAMMSVVVQGEVMMYAPLQRRERVLLLLTFVYTEYRRRGVGLAAAALLL